MRKLNNFKKVMLGAAMAAVMSMGTLGVNATLGVKTGSYNSEWMGKVDYTLKVDSSYASMKATKNTPCYGLMVRVCGKQKNGQLVKATSGQSSSGVVIGRNPDIGTFVDGYGQIFYQGIIEKKVEFGK